MFSSYFFFTVTPPTEIYTLSLHDALPIFWFRHRRHRRRDGRAHGRLPSHSRASRNHGSQRALGRSEEHTSELQSQFHLVCRLLLEKKNINHSHSRYCRITYLYNLLTYFCS